MPKPKPKATTQRLEVHTNPDAGVDLLIGQHRLWLSDEDAGQLITLLVQQREKRYRRLAKQQRQEAES